ncbi:MAG: hypothetical protein PUD59_06005 [bacterium]|nr:hypothetical protein [bacterium]
MKKVIINIVKFTIFVSIFVILIIALGNILMPTGWKSNYQGQIFTTRGFYEMPDNQIDVLFLGSSTIQKGISPMELYNNKGITSYNYAVSSARSYMMYYFMIDILKTQKPKVVFIDPITLFYSESERESEPEQRKSFDNMPFSKNKVNMIFDNVFNTTFEEKISYIFPLLRYHSRWKELTIQDLTKLNNSYHSITKGYLMSSKIKPCNDGKSYMIPNNRNVNMTNYTKKYIIKLLKLCKDNNIDVVFLGIPDVRAWNYESSVFLDEFAKQNEVRFLDLNHYELYDWSTDFDDGGYHMNLFGAIKTTKYVEDYIVKNYNFFDKRNDMKYKSWNNDFDKYLLEKNKSINILNKAKHKK